MNTVNKAKIYLKYLKEIFKICKEELEINPKLPKQRGKRIKYFENMGLGLHPKWDSLNHVKILHCIEEKYRFEITEDNVIVTSGAKQAIYEALYCLFKNHTLYECAIPIPSQSVLVITDSSSLTLPLRFIIDNLLSLLRQAIPAESYPRYSNLSNPFNKIG